MGRIGGYDFRRQVTASTLPFIATNIERQTMKDQRIIVIGGTSGIGLESARRFAAQGASVTVTGRDAAKGAALDIPGIRFARLDAAVRAQCDAFFADHGSFDHLVVCASGAAGAGAFRELALDDLRAGFEGKFWPQLHALQASLGSITPGGSATLVGAISARAQQPGTAGLAAINGALEAMLPILASELRPLRVNMVAPGVIDTPWWHRVPDAQRSRLFEEMGAAVPAGRVGTAADVADVIIMLAGNTFITGSVIDVDGGWKLRR
jgi:NAD(P)-dependent dehydrogenase (short-subunit alcohol dehydrogenase family)